jgi:tetratricopeptide (TPR) repeat protein
MQGLLHGVLAAALAFGPAVSERESVQALAQRADAAFAAGDFVAAREALLEALAVEPDNLSLVYGLAQAERFLDNCARAVELFDRFLLADPPEEQAKAAKAKRAECTDAPPPEPAAEPEPTPAIPPPSSAIEREPPPPVVDRKPIAGPVLVGVGGAIAITGAALVGLAFGTAARAPDASTQDEYDARRGRVVPLAAAGWASLGVGVAVAIAGGIAWGIAKRRRSRALAEF